MKFRVKQGQTIKHDGKCAAGGAVLPADFAPEATVASVPMTPMRPPGRSSGQIPSRPSCRAPSSSLTAMRKA